MAKKKKMQKKTLRITILGGAVLLVICALGLIIPSLVENLVGEGNFKIEDRTKNILKEKKKDEEGYETIAWLRVQGTRIDTPIIGYSNVEAINNIQKEDFLWNENDQEKLHNRVNIQGHNILNLSANPEVGLKYFTKFEELMGFVYTDFAKENQYVQYTVDGENYLYQIFAVYFEEDYRLDLYRNEDYSEEEVKTFINRSLEKSIYKYDIEVKDTDKIITLITCTRMYGVDDKKQFVVVGKMVDNNTPTASYKVEETSHYEQIKKLMEGVDENVEA